MNSFARALELGPADGACRERRTRLPAAEQTRRDGADRAPSIPHCRPPAGRGRATNRAIRLAEVIGCPIYIVHVSNEESLQAIMRARGAGQRVFGEVLAGHLTIDESVYRHPGWRIAAAHVMSPPFRARHHQDAVGRAAGGHLHHGDRPLRVLRRAEGDGRRLLAKIPNGCAGIEDRMAVVWDAGVNTGRLTPNEYVRVTSTNAAQIFNMYPRRGAIAVGSDADLVVCRIRRRPRRSPPRPRCPKVGYNVFEGRTVQGCRWSRSPTAGWPGCGDLRAVRGTGRYLEAAAVRADVRCAQGRAAQRAPSAVAQRRAARRPVALGALMATSDIRADAWPPTNTPHFADAHPPLTPAQALIEADRCYYCFDAPCTAACPTGIDVPSFIRRIGEGSLRGAARAILEQNVFGGMCARVCPTEVLCEQACVRNTHEDKPVEIGLLQRHATDHLFAHPAPAVHRAPASGKRVAVVGAGPAGLSCAHRPRRARPRGGGARRAAEGRRPERVRPGELPRRRTTSRRRRSSGCVHRRHRGMSTAATSAATSRSALCGAYDAAVFSRSGWRRQRARAGRRAGLGLQNAVDFIAACARRAISRPCRSAAVVVIGGGMTAVDAAVQSRKLGAEK